jgi:hypothetical protein
MASAGLRPEQQAASTIAKVKTADFRAKLDSMRTILWAIPSCPRHPRNAMADELGERTDSHVADAISGRSSPGIKGFST